MAAPINDNLHSLLERMTEMRREACRLQAAATHGSLLFIALDELMAGCDDFLNVMEDEAGADPAMAARAAA